MSTPKTGTASPDPSKEAVEPTDAPDAQRPNTDEPEPRTRPETPQSQRAVPAGPPPILALDVDDVLAPHFAEQVRHAHADRRAKDRENPTDAEKLEADRWIDALRTMVKHNRAKGPARIEFFTGDKGSVSVHLLTGAGKDAHASGTLILASDQPGPIPPAPQPRPTGNAPPAGPRGGPTGPKPGPARPLPGGRLGPTPPRNPTRR